MSGLRNAQRLISLTVEALQRGELSESSNFHVMTGDLLFAPSAFLFSNRNRLASLSDPCVGLTPLNALASQRDPPRHRRQRLETLAEHSQNRCVTCWHRSWCFAFFFFPFLALFGFLGLSLWVFETVRGLQMLFTQSPGGKRSTVSSLISVKCGRCGRDWR
jgi:hypothetical protein